MGMDPIIDREFDLPSFSWNEVSDELEAAIQLGMRLRTLARGREADVLVGGEPAAVVVKVWPLGAGTAERQLAFLRAMERCLPVPAGLGWGTDGAGRQALAMRYAGKPVTEPEPAEVGELARILARVHQTAAPSFLPVDRSYEVIIGHLFPQVGDDLAEAARVLAERLPAFQATLIHGDFHPGNVVVGRNGMTIVDWTEARISDWRFDLAWAMALLTIYYPEGLGEEFLRDYAQHANLSDTRELDAFIAIVGLHWIHLARTAPVPINEEWWVRAEQLVRQRLRRLPPLPGALARPEFLQLRPRRPQH